MAVDPTATITVHQRFEFKFMVPVRVSWLQATEALTNVRTKKRRNNLRKTMKRLREKERPGGGKDSDESSVQARGPATGRSPRRSFTVSQFLFPPLLVLCLLLPLISLETHILGAEDLMGHASRPPWPAPPLVGTRVPLPEETEWLPGGQLQLPP